MVLIQFRQTSLNLLCSFLLETLRKKGRICDSVCLDAYNKKGVKSFTNPSGLRVFYNGNKRQQKWTNKPPLRPKQIGFQADDKESSHCDPPLSDRRAIYQQLGSSLSHSVKEQCMILSGYVCTCIITEESTFRAAAIISAFVLFSRLIQLVCTHAD